MIKEPIVAAEKNIAELSLRAIVLAIVLTILLAMSNAFLALKLGILTSASIPAAIISMGILRFFKNSTVLENNAVQTAASAGEAVAGGIVYTIPALIIIGYWQSFDYLTNFFIAFSGGVLGVLFSIPLRRILVNDENLKFPEGRAIAEVLKSSVEKSGIKDILLGGIVGAAIEFLQTGIKVLASEWSYTFIYKRSLFSLGAGFSATMIGAGYLIGHEMASSIFLGAIISWFISLPLLSRFYPNVLNNSPDYALHFLWNNEMRYLGIGAMLFAGIWTFLKLIKPLSQSVRISLNLYSSKRDIKSLLPRTDRDIPLPYILMGVGVMAAILFLFFQTMLPLEQVGLYYDYAPTIVFCAVLYVIFIGFLFSVITAYFSGMVGVTASPGSSVVISGMLFAAWLLLIAVNHLLPLPFSPQQIQASEAITIIIGSVVTGIAAIANDNTQDLKVGQLVGATPWKQQIMLLLGVVISSLVIPPVMQLLFEVYGIAGVMPHNGMDATQSLPAPTAALMAAITDAVFNNSLPWLMMFIGASFVVFLLVIQKICKLVKYFNLSILGVAIGMYLPISSSFPLFIGGMIAFFTGNSKSNMENIESSKGQQGILIACGLVAGSAIMDVLLAIPFSITKNPNFLQIPYPSSSYISVILSVITVALLAFWIKIKVKG